MTKSYLERLEAFSGVREAAAALDMEHSILRRAARLPDSAYAPDCALRRGGRLSPLWSDERLAEIKKERGAK
jgi:hypothetical protein